MPNHSVCAVFCVELSDFFFAIDADFDTAVKVAAMLAEEGDTVLLSPACASFDRFSGFIERGNRFNEIVGMLP